MAGLLSLLFKHQRPAPGYIQNRLSFFSQGV